MEYIVKYGQNFLDIALQELGSIEGVLILARDNNLSITADLEIGQIIKVDITKIIDKKVVEYYQNNKIIVATDIPRPNKRQTIKFPAIKDLNIGDSITLEAMASSGLTVLYFSSNPSVAVIENNTLTIVGAGNVTITASQVGDNIWYPASASQAITVINIALDETNLVFDFDFQATAKQSIRDGIYLENYVDRGVAMGQSIASIQPVIDAMGMRFGLNASYLELSPVNIKEIWFVCNNLSGTVFNGYDGLITTIAGGAGPSISAYINSSLMGFGGGVNAKVNNFTTNEFAPLSQFKSFSQNWNPPTQAFFVGAGYQYYRWKGYINRILIFDEVLSEERRTALQAYLAYTYSL